MNKKKIERINELAQKAKTQGLTAEETSEREQLRKEYLASIRKNVRATLDNVVVQQEDGSLVPLKKRDPNQTHHQHCGCGCHDHDHHHHHHSECGCGHHHEDEKWRQ